MFPAVQNLPVESIQVAKSLQMRMRVNVRDWWAKVQLLCDGCVCRLAGVRAVMGEGGLQESGLSKAKQ